MLDSAEIYVMGFLALGGVVILLPAVVLGKITPVGLLKGVLGMASVIAISSFYYLATTDAGIIEILSLEVDAPLLPNRVFSVSYVLLAVFVVLVPLAIIRGLFNRESSKA